MCGLRPRWRQRSMSDHRTSRSRMNQRKRKKERRVRMKEEQEKEEKTEQDGFKPSWWAEPKAQLKSTQPQATTFEARSSEVVTENGAPLKSGIPITPRIAGNRVIPEGRGTDRTITWIALSTAPRCPIWSNVWTSTQTIQGKGQDIWEECHPPG